MVAYRLVDLMGRVSAANILGITVRELDKLVEVFEISEKFTKLRDPSAAITRSTPADSPCSHGSNPHPRLARAPASLFAPTPKAVQRVLEFFAAQINNENTRKSLPERDRRFVEWCDAHGLLQLPDVQPFHVVAFVKDLQGQFTPPTVKQHLAAAPELADIEPVERNSQPPHGPCHGAPFSAHGRAGGGSQ